MSEQQESYRTAAEDNFKTRLLAEEKELRIKLRKLHSFVGSEKFFKEVSIPEQSLLVIQLTAMTGYHHCIVARIDIHADGENDMDKIKEKFRKQTIKTTGRMDAGQIAKEFLKAFPEEKTQEQLYIGCKVIKATPMSSNEYSKLKGDPDHNAENTPGYKVEYPDGYISWSPKWVFENAYRLITEGEKELFI